MRLHLHHRHSAQQPMEPATEVGPNNGAILSPWQKPASHIGCQSLTQYNVPDPTAANPPFFRHPRYTSHHHGYPMDSPPLAQNVHSGRGDHIRPKSVQNGVKWRLTPRTRQRMPAQVRKSNSEHFVKPSIIGTRNMLYSTMSTLIGWPQPRDQFNPHKPVKSDV